MAKSCNVSTKAEEYKRKAKEAEEAAARVHSEAAKLIYLGIARKWQEIVAWAERDKPQGLGEPGT